MAAPPYPYHIILAGKYGVGKTSLFRFLSQRSQQNTSARGWDKYEHVVNLESEAVQVFCHLQMLLTPHYMMCVRWYCGTQPIWRRITSSACLKATSTSVLE